MYVADFLELLDDGRSSAFSVENTYIGENKSAVFLPVRIRIARLRCRAIRNFYVDFLFF